MKNYSGKKKNRQEKFIQFKNHTSKIEFDGIDFIVDNTNKK